MNKYPCKECIVHPNCSELCDNLTNDFKSIFDNLETGKCPDCGNEKMAYVSETVTNDCYACRCKVCDHYFKNSEHISFFRNIWSNPTPFLRR